MVHVTIFDSSHFLMLFTQAVLDATPINWDYRDHHTLSNLDKKQVNLCEEKLTNSWPEQTNMKCVESQLIGGNTQNSNTVNTLPLHFV